MEPFKVKFILISTMTDQDAASSDTVSYINKVLINMGTAQSLGFISKANAEIRTAKTQIEEMVLEEFNKSDITFNLVNLTLPIIVSGRTHIPNTQLSFEYEMPLKIESVEYTCINIFYGATFVCYKESDKIIRFITMNSKISPIRIE